MRCQNMLFMRELLGQLLQYSKTNALLELIK